MHHAHGAQSAMTFHGTTILVVRKDGRVALGGDGQVSIGDTIVKSTANKVRSLKGGQGAGRLRGLGGRCAHALREVRGEARPLSRQPAARGGGAGQGLAQRPGPAPARGAAGGGRPGAQLSAERLGRADRAGRWGARGRLGRQLRARRRARAARRLRRSAPRHRAAVAWRSRRTSACLPIAISRCWSCDDDRVATQPAEPTAAGSRRTPSRCRGWRRCRPRQIVAELDRYIVGQDAAKKAIAIAVRNRWRRAQAPEQIRDEITPTTSS